MARKIVPIPFSRVLKLEFHELVTSFVSIIWRYNPTTMRLEDPYRLLLEAMPQLETLKVVSKEQPGLKPVVSLRERRMNVLVALKGQVKSASRAKLASQEQLLCMVNPVMNQYWVNIYRNTSKTTSELLRQMLHQLDINSELQVAFDLLGFGIYINELRDIQRELEEKTINCKRVSSAKPKMQTKQVKSTLGEALQDMVNCVEVARKANLATDYMPMINEINTLFVSYRASIKGRKSRNVKSSEKRKQQQQISA